MATQSTKHTAEIVVISFVDQYYHISQNLIHLMYRFYKENSILSWPLPDGEIDFVTTSKGINEFIVSSHFKSNKVEVTTTDFQSSAAGGVLVMVTGCLIGQDDLRKESSTIVEEKVDENAPIVPLALMPSSGGVEKVPAPPTNVAQDNYDNVQHKSIFIGGFPLNTTRSDLHDVVKEFGSVQIQNIQLKTYEDGYCCDFVHFQDAISAQNAVQAHHIIVKGKESYIRFKRPNKGRSKRANFSLDTEEKVIQQ
ncbi:hypothetical protein BC332_27544 [Capsicum chinense]|nr:hypothetical protein BC332_27544 [Capsicum chinense]